VEIVGSTELLVNTDGTFAASAAGAAAGGFGAAAVNIEVSQFVLRHGVFLSMGAVAQ
jgi:hypothetical protein